MWLRLSCIHGSYHSSCLKITALSSQFNIFAKVVQIFIIWHNVIAWSWRSVVQCHGQVSLGWLPSGQSRWMHFLAEPISLQPTNFLYDFMCIKLFANCGTTSCYSCICDSWLAWWLPSRQSYVSHNDFEMETYTLIANWWSPWYLQETLMKPKRHGCRVPGSSCSQTCAMHSMHCNHQPLTCAQQYATQSRRKSYGARSVDLLLTSAQHAVWRPMSMLCYIGLNNGRWVGG